jgi:hypothetical protein
VIRDKENAMQIVTAGINRLALIFLFGVVCFAQMPYGSIVGRIVDKEQGRIPGAAVKIGRASCRERVCQYV